MSYTCVFQANIGVKTKILTLLASSLTLLPSAYADQLVSIDHSKTICDDCYTPKTLSVMPDEKVIWTNNDSSVHSVTSKSTSEDFDSSLIHPGGSFEHTFTVQGQHSYHCILHPWAIGYITVEILSDEEITIETKKSMKTIEVDNSTYSVDYVSTTEITTTDIDHNLNAITFGFVEPIENENLILRVPTDIMTSPYYAVGNVSIVNGSLYFERELPISVSDRDSYNLVTVEIGDAVNNVTIQGTKVIPEFGTTVLIILAIAITSVVAMSRRQGVLVK